MHTPFLGEAAKNLRRGTHPIAPCNRSTDITSIDHNLAFIADFVYKIIVATANTL